jgi:ubiquinone/menaquinone biosynthesis C-methylase UbiE
VDEHHPVVAAFYDVLMVPNDWLGLRRQRARLAEAATGRVLEIGVGTGLNLSHFINATEVVAIDPDPHMLKRATRRATEAPCPVYLEVLPGENMHFPANEFDTVVISLILCTIPDPGMALREAHRVLKLDGSLIFLEHVRSPHDNTARFQDWITPYWRRVSGGCHTNRSTLDTIEDNGFEITKLWRSKSGSMVQGAARKIAERSA